VDDLAKCGQMKDWNRDAAPDATQFPLPPVRGSRQLVKSQTAMRQLQPKVEQTCNNISRMNLSGYAGHVTIFS